MTKPAPSPDYWTGFTDALLTFRGTDRDGIEEVPVREYTAMRLVRAVMVDLAVHGIKHAQVDFNATRAMEAAGRLLDLFDVEDPFPDNVITFAECRRRREVRHG